MYAPPAPHYWLTSPTKRSSEIFQIIINLLRRTRASIRRPWAMPSRLSKCLRVTRQVLPQHGHKLLHHHRIHHHPRRQMRGARHELQKIDHKLMRPKVGQKPSGNQPLSATFSGMRGGGRMMRKTAPGCWSLAELPEGDGEGGLGESDMAKNPSRINRRNVR